MSDDTRTLGSIIGAVEHNFTVTNSAGIQVQLRVKFDYSSMNDQAITNLVLRSTTIDFQRPTRTLSEGEIRELNNSTIIAQDAGRKQKSRTEQIQGFKAAFVSAGIDEEQADKLAIAAVDNPQLLTTKDEDKE